MAKDASLRSKKLEVFDKLHLGMDHVLAKLLMDAPPLPSSLKLHTETQSLATTWVHVTEIFEKRRATLLRRKEKEKNKEKRRKEASAKEKEEKGKEKGELKPKKTQKSKNLNVSEENRHKMESKTSKATSGASPRGPKPVVDVKKDEGLPGHDKLLLKKLRKLPMCRDLSYGSKKYKAIVKWIELDKGDNDGTSMELMQLLDKLQLQTASEMKNKPKTSRKRPLEPVGATKRDKKRKTLSQARGRKKRREEEEESEEDEKSESDEAEFVPDLETTSTSSMTEKKSKKKATARLPKGKEQNVDRKEGTKAVSRKEKAQPRAEEVDSASETRYLSYDKQKPELPAPGASPSSAIVLEDSEEEENEEEEDEGEGEEEDDSSTDDDHGLFDLNEEDVYVVESILSVKEGRVLLSGGGPHRHKESDLYLVKWEGYDELTWEPDENIPQRLIEMFRERERAKRACQYQIKVAHERREVTNGTTQVKDIIYLIQWINQDVAVWESRTTLPTKTQVWLDKVLGVTPTKKRRDTKAVKQYVYQ